MDVVEYTSEVIDITKLNAEIEEIILREAIRSIIEEIEGGM